MCKVLLLSGAGTFTLGRYTLGLFTPNIFTLRLNYSLGVLPHGILVLKNFYSEEI